MRIILDICGEFHEFDSSIIEKCIIVKERLIGDTYFIGTPDCCFSCHKNFWEPFKREKNINLIIHSKKFKSPTL
jgi:hypothetical protein